MASYRFLVFFLLLFSACNYSKNVQLLTAGKVKQKGYTYKIPFTYRKDLIVVKVQLQDDTTHYEFIFDTGAFNSKIEKGLAQRLGLQPKAEKSNSDAMGNERLIEVTQLDSLRLGELAFYKIGAGMVVYDSLSASPCIASGGIIGANLIKLANWKIDYKKQLLWVSDQPFETDPTRPVHELSFSHPVFSGTPSITLELGGKEVSNILLDVGSNGSLRLPKAVQSSFPPSEKRTFFDQTQSGIYGTRADTMYQQQIDWALDDTTFPLIVNFRGGGKGLLGNEVLDQFEVIIDYDEDLISLQPYVSTPKKLDWNANFIPRPLNDSLWLVSRSVPDLPLQLGDTLRTINNLRPAQLFQGYCDYFMSVRDLLDTDSLEVVTLDGKKVMITHD